MVKAGKEYAEAYTLSELKGKEILVIRSDDEYSHKDMVALSERIQASNPNWAGTLLVLRTDQMLEKMTEPMAFALYQALKKCFEPVAVDAPNAPASETTS